MIVPPATSLVLTPIRDPPYYWGTTLILSCSFTNYDTQLVDTLYSSNISITRTDTNAVKITLKSNGKFRPLLPIHSGTYTCISIIVSLSNSTFITPSRESTSNPFVLNLTGNNNTAL